MSYFNGRRINEWGMMKKKRPNLKEENDALKARVAELEKENENLRFLQIENQDCGHSSGAEYVVDSYGSVVCSMCAYDKNRARIAALEGAIKTQLDSCGQCGCGACLKAKKALSVGDKTSTQEHLVGDVDGPDIMNEGARD